MGLRQSRFFPLRYSKCVSLRRPNDFPVCHTLRHPCPATGKTYGACKGYVIDHVVPLKRGVADAPNNMQWQTVAEARDKDKIE